LRRNLKLILGVVLLVAVQSVLFMVLMDYDGQPQNADVQTAVYWVMETITTLGYGDIVFRSPLGRLFSTAITLSVIAILWAVILPLIVTPIIESLIRSVPTSAPSKLKDHVIISGYSSAIEVLVERLSALKIPFVVIERSEEAARGIYERYPTIWGDPSEKDVLERAGAGTSRLFIANEREELNAEVILTVKEMTRARIIALADDLTKAPFLSCAGAARVVSPKTLLGAFVAHIATPPEKGVFPGAIKLFGDVLLAELPIYPGSPLVGRSISSLRSSFKEPIQGIIGLWQKGAFNPYPGQDDVIQINSVLMAAGSAEQLTRVRNLTVGSSRAGPLILLGYGDVGRRICRVMVDKGIKPVVVDKRELKDLPFPSVIGDGTSEEVLEMAGIREAVGVAVMLNSDSDVIYATLLARNLNPQAFIVARTNRARSVDKIYMAGADYVASVSLLTSRILARAAQDDGEELDLLYQDLELERLEIRGLSKLAGRSLGELRILQRFGCRIAAIDRRGQVILDIDGCTVIARGDVAAVLGSPENIAAFNKVYRTG
jgi:Trk K+ transport system NAD-binding subunit